MRRWLSLVLAAAIAITACAPVDPEGFDWCHIYYLDEPMANLFIDHGEQYIVGGAGILGEYVGDGNYFFQFEIIEPFNVYPDAMEVVFKRGYIDQQNITMRLPQGTAFGHDISVMAGVGLAPGVPFARYPITFDFNEAEPVGDDRITAQFYTNGDMYVAEIAVYGHGVSPYGYTECGNAAATNTPIDQPPTETVIPTATNTPIPTITLTPTLTHTPTATPVCYPDTTFDFTVSDHGWTDRAYQSRPFGNWVTGVGWQGEWGSVSSQNDMRLYMRYLFPSDTIVDEVTATFDITGSTGNSQRSVSVSSILSTGATFSSAQSFPWTLGNNQTLTVGVGYPIRELHFTFTGGATVSGQNQVTLKSVYINGNCTLPTPTYTPSLTHTPTITNTPAPITNTPTASNTPGGAASRTPVPTLTRTLTPSNIPPVRSPTPLTPTLTWTMENTLPAPTAIPTRTLLPPSTAIGTVTAEATYPVPGFGTGAPDITAIGTAPSLGTLAPVGGHSDIYNLLGTAVVEVNDLPGDMTGYVPNPDITPLIGYAKWFLSCSSLYEILGQNVGTAACHATVGVSLIVILSAVYTGLRVIVLVMKFAVWIFMKIRDLIPLI